MPPSGRRDLSEVSAGYLVTITIESEQFESLFDRFCWAEQKALHLIAAFLLETGKLLARFDTFGSYLHAHASA